MGIHIEENRIERDTYTPVFITALFTVARTWKQTRCHGQTNGYESCGTYAAADAKSLQLCLTLSDPRDCSLPGSSINGIFQARVLEWVAQWNITQL